MLRVLTTMFCLSAFYVFGAFAIAVENEASPELAKKAAVVFLVNHHGDEVETGYPVKVSEPKVFFSYDNTRRYYIVYTYVGPGIIPTWEELGKNPHGEYEYFRSFLIPADKREMGYLWGHSGIPEPIRSKERAEKIINSKYPGEQVEYVKTVIQGSSIFLTFRVSGKEYFVSPTWGHVHESSAEIGVAPPPDPEKYRALAGQMWAEVDNTDVSEYLLKGTDGINIREGLDDSSYNPSGFYTQIPKYEKYDAEAPGGNWGCAGAAMADFLGMYIYHKGYIWDGMPAKETYKGQNFGRWIMGDRTEGKGGLYYKLSLYGSGDPTGVDSAGVMACALNDWLVDYCASTDFNPSSYNQGYFGPLSQWSTIKTALTFRRGVNLTCHPTGPGSESGPICLWGWKEIGVPVSEHWVAGWNPEYPASQQETEIWFERELGQGWTFGFLELDNPGYGGQNDPVVTSLVYEVNKKGVVFYWTNTRPEVIKYLHLASSKNIKGRRTFDRIKSLCSESSIPTSCVIDLASYDNDADYYLEITWIEGLFQLEKFHDRNQ